jgi:predicted P-loop ATPase
LYEIKNRLSEALKDVGLDIERDSKSKGKNLENKKNNHEVDSVDIKTRIPISAAGKRPLSFQLSDQAREQYAFAIQLYTEIIVTQILSNNFNAREQGLRAVLNKFESFTAAQSDLIVNGTKQILDMIENDNREKSHFLYCEIFKTLVGICD